MKYWLSADQTTKLLTVILLFIHSLTFTVIVPNRVSDSWKKIFWNMFHYYWTSRYTHVIFPCVCVMYFIHLTNSSSSSNRKKNENQSHSQIQWIQDSIEWMIQLHLVNFFFNFIILYSLTKNDDDDVCHDGSCGHSKYFPFSIHQLEIHTNTHTLILFFEIPGKKEWKAKKIQFPIEMGKKTDISTSPSTYSIHMMMMIRKWRKKKKHFN